MTLYEIDQRLLELVDPETGELLDYDAFASLQMERTEKLENMALWVKDLTAEAKALAGEIQTLQERKRAAEAKAERLKGYLDRALDGQSFSTARCLVTFRRSKALKVENEAALCRYLSAMGYRDLVRLGEPTCDKREVKRLIEAGTDIPFASIEERVNMGVK